MGLESATDGRKNSMKLNLLNTRLEYSLEEMLNVIHTLDSAIAVLKQLRLEVKERAHIEQLDFVLNKLICEVPDKLSVS